MSLEKCAIFIDGGYLNRILKSNFRSPNIDLLKLCNKIADDTNTTRLRTYYYHCLPYTKEGDVENAERRSKMQSFLTKIKRLPRFEVKLGRLQCIGGEFKQKMVDVLMSLDIVDMCFERQIDHAILIAGDSDFVPAIQRARDTGTIIHLYYHPGTVHIQLLDVIDELHEINGDFLEQCILK